MMADQPNVPIASGWAALTAARRHAISSLDGTVLEIGAGRGVNFAQLGPGVQWIGLEPSARLRRKLASNARRHGHRSAPLAAAAESIPLPDHSVDGVLATKVLCSVTDQHLVFAELARVLRPGGSAVFVEHVAAPAKTGMHAILRLVRPLTMCFAHGCDPTRETAEAVRHSELDIVELSCHPVPIIGSLKLPYVVITATKPHHQTAHN